MTAYLRPGMTARHASVASKHPRLGRRVLTRSQKPGVSVLDHECANDRSLPEPLR